MDNIRIDEFIVNGRLMFYRLFAENGYKIRCPLADSYVTDDEGNYMLDDNGNRILDEPYYSDGIMVTKDYDFEANPNEYRAEVIK